MALLIPKDKSVEGRGGAPGGMPVVLRGPPSPALQKARLHLCSAARLVGQLLANLSPEKHQVLPREE